MTDSSDGFEKQSDVVVIGSGVTGGWAAKELAEAGLTVLLLEAGPRLEFNRVLSLKERAEAATRQLIQCQHPSYWYEDPRLFVDDLQNPYVTSNGPFVWIRSRHVGGRSLTWLGVTLRLSDYELLGPEREGFGVNWPLTYEELAPYYDRVEQFLEIEGSREGLLQLPDGPFMLPPSLTSWESEFQRVVESKWPGRRVIHCRGLPLHALNRGSNRLQQGGSIHEPLVSAAATGRLRLRPDSIVSRFIDDQDTGLIRSVMYLDRNTKAVREASARAYVLCASSFESVRIMLNSESPRHPRGIGNSSGLLGRFIFDHGTASIGGTLDAQAKSDHAAHLGGAHGILIPRFRGLDRRMSDYVGGFGIWGSMNRHFQWVSVENPAWALTSLLEVLPRSENRIEIDQMKEDAWGIKSARICFAYGDNEQSMNRDALSSMKEMADAAGLKLGYENTTLPGQYVHELGGARMGRNNKTSVLNPFNQCWDAPNLFVTDGSCFVSAGWQNPSLTMMALTARACEYLVHELAIGNLPTAALASMSH